MVRRADGIDFTHFFLERRSATPLFQQLYQLFRREILSGKLKPGTRLPSTRTLAESLSLSRNTVLMAYEQLLAEGFFEGQVGSGTFVSDAIAQELFTEQELFSETEGGTITEPFVHAPALLQNPMVVMADRTLPKPFRAAVPDISAFPYSLWGKLQAKYWRKSPGPLLDYGRTAGYQPLCQAIAEYLKTSRGVQCHEAQILITTGSQQALSLSIRALLSQGDAVWMEEPGYPGARLSFEEAQARLFPVPIDQDGLMVDVALQQAPEAKLAFVTPSHQYPLGTAMKLSRRLSLLDWAKRQSSWILEDDYDSEFRYGGKPLMSLQGLDQHGRVLYMGTFSKVLFPSLRLGYLVVPDALIDTFYALRAITDQHPPTIDQAVLTEFIEKGFFMRHLRQMRVLYAQRQVFLKQLLATHLAKWLTCYPDTAGMHLVVLFTPYFKKKGITDVSLAHAGLQVGLNLVPLSNKFIQQPAPMQGLILGYAAYTQDVMEEAILCLKQLLEGLDTP